MRSTDSQEFATLIARTWRFYGKTPTGEDVADWFDLLKECALDAVAAAFKRHLTDPDRGQYPPKPADIIRHLTGTATRDGRPGPDEAWGLLVRLIRDKRETGSLTEEMRVGWQACQPILDLGDEIGARKCFLETYVRCVEEARQIGTALRWTVSLGTDPQLREQRLVEAVKAKRITADHARTLLPGPAPVSLDQVAGLLEGHDASAPEAKIAERLRALAALLRNSDQEDATERTEQRRRAIERESAEKQRLWELAQRSDRGEKAA